MTKHACMQSCIQLYCLFQSPPAMPVPVLACKVQGAGVSATFSVCSLHFPVTHSAVSCACMLSAVSCACTHSAVPCALSACTLLYLVHACAGQGTEVLATQNVCIAVCLLSFTDSICIAVFQLSLTDSICIAVCLSSLTNSF